MIICKGLQVVGYNLQPLTVEIANAAPEVAAAQA